jgi:hypothetical protein
MNQDTGKFVVNDLERIDTEKQERKQKRKTEGYGADSDTDSDDEGGVRGATSK